MERRVRVRFAPSPTGPLHIGGVRTALYNYLFARQHGGDLIFRIEDTDSGRFVPGAEEYIIESFKWLGIKFDEGVSFGGDKGPYRQSERRDIYRRYVKQLLDEGVIRYAGISRVNNEQIDIARTMLGDKLIAVQNQFSPSHPDPEHTVGHCRELGLAFVCWSPLGGFLDAFDQRAYDPFRAVAGEHGCSYQRVVLAWELAQYERLYTIPSARNPHEINDSFAATGLELTCDELARLNRAVFGGSRLR